MKKTVTMMLLAFAVMSFSLTGCKSNAGEEIPTKEQYEQYVKELGPIQEQLGLVIVKHSAIEDGKFTIKISREEMVELGFPSIAYDVALYDANQINITLESLDEEVKMQAIADLEEQIQYMQNN